VENGIEMYVNKYIENNIYVDESEKEIIRFGLSMMITSIIALMVAVVISFMMGMLIEGILLLVSIIVLRQYAGGYHAKSQSICAVISCLIYSACLLFIKYSLMNYQFQRRCIYVKKLEYL